MLSTLTNQTKGWLSIQPITSYISVLRDDDFSHACIKSFISSRACRGTFPRIVL